MRIPFTWSVSVLLAATLVCLLAGCSGSQSISSPSAGHPEWKVSRDSTGSCEVATPPGWQLARDFYLERETAGPVPGETGVFPPMGDAIWPSPRPSGDWYQLRTSVTQGTIACSVWRLKQSSGFTAEEKAEMNQVGATLKVVP